MANLIFYLMAIVGVISGLGVIIARNPIHSALWLVLNLIVVAGIYASLNAHFLAVVQIIVYAGAIMVLVLFVLMFLNIKEETPCAYTYLSWVVAAILGVSFALVMLQGLGGYFGAKLPLPIGVAGDVAGMGRQIYTRWLFSFEIASLLIMAALVGAVMLAKREKGGSNG